MEVPIYRDFAYWDTKKVEGYLSMIKGGFSSIKKEKEDFGSIGAGKEAFGIKASIGTGKKEEERTITPTEHSVFNELYEILKKEKKLITEDSVNLNDDSLKNFSYGSIVDLELEVQISRVDALLDLFVNYAPLLSDDKKTLKTADLMVNLFKRKRTSDLRISAKPLFETDYNLGGIINRNSLKIETSDLGGNFRIFFQVKKFLKEDEKFELFSLIPGVKLSQEQKNDFISKLGTLPDMVGDPIYNDDLELKHPCIVMMPFAIYK